MSDHVYDDYNDDSDDARKKDDNVNKLITIN